MMESTFALLSIAAILPRICAQEITLQRPLKAGDIVTPNDFIEIAKRLRHKVEYPGAGRGIVSSSKNAEGLADRLFQGFFFTTVRFVPLKESDIAGLDALQALALCGKDYDPEFYLVRVPYDNRKHLSPRRCQYALVTRTLDKDEDPQIARRKAIPLAKKLMKKRKLQVERRTNETDIDGRDNVTDTRRKNMRYFFGDVKGRKNNKQCIWKYMCKEEDDMDSCRIYPECGEVDNHFTVMDLPIHHREDEHKESIKQIRDMMGVYIVDEEVEKIFERRYLLLTPKMVNGRDISRSPGDIADNLIEYYERLIKAEDAKTTSSYGFRNDKELERNQYLAIKNAMSWGLKPDNHFRRSEDIKKNHEDKTESGKTLRKYLSDMPVTTPYTTSIKRQ